VTTVIYRPERYLIAENLQKIASYVQGKTLDMGAGSINRYSFLFKEKVSTHVRIDRSYFEGIDIVGDGSYLPFKNASFD